MLQALHQEYSLQHLFNISHIFINKKKEIYLTKNKILNTLVHQYKPVNRKNTKKYCLNKYKMSSQKRN